MNKISLVLTACLLLGACSEKTILLSPDGEKCIVFSLDGTGSPVYSLGVSGKPLLADSQMGLEAEGIDLSGGFEIIRVRHSEVSQKWSQPWGENKEISDVHNEMSVLLRNDEGVELTVRFRAFDDGAGFRYEYATPADSLVIVGENTRFNFAEDGTSWSIGSYFSGYELPYREQNISEVENANTPFTFRTSSVYGSIHEAALYDFPEMNIYRQDSLSFKSELAPRPDGTLAHVAGSFVTPWRTIQISDSAVGLINSSLILNLNELFY